MLRQEKLQMSVVTESTEAAETKEVHGIDTGTETGTEVEKILTGGMDTGPLLRITEATSLAGIGKNVITGHPETGTGQGTIQEIATEMIHEGQMHTNDPGLKSFCQGLFHKGMQPSWYPHSTLLLQGMLLML